MMKTSRKCKWRANERFGHKKNGKNLCCSVLKSSSSHCFPAFFFLFFSKQTLFSRWLLLAFRWPFPSCSFFALFSRNFNLFFPFFFFFCSVVDFISSATQKNIQTKTTLRFLLFLFLSHISLLLSFEKQK